MTNKVTRSGFLAGLLGLIGISKADAQEPVDFHARNVEAEHGLIGGYLKVRGAAQAESLHSNFLGAHNLNVQHTTSTHKLNANIIQTTRLIIPVGVDAWTTPQELSN